MSSFRVSNEHIACIVSAANRGLHRPQWLNDAGQVRSLDPSHPGKVSPQEVGQMLLDWNDRALAARYGDGPGLPFHRDPCDDQVPLPPVLALKALDCLEYQCAEYDGWQDCEAYRFCQSTRRHLIGQLPGYDLQPWAIAPDGWGYKAARAAARAKVQGVQS